MQYVNVPHSISTASIATSDWCLSPGRYVQFIPPDATADVEFVPLDQIVRLSSTTERIKRSERYHYAEIGSIDPESGLVSLDALHGHEVPARTALKLEAGFILLSTVRTYRMGIGVVAEPADNMIASGAIMLISGIKPPWDKLIDLHYILAVLRTKFFVEQVWSLLNRGVYPRMDKGALHRILIPVPKEKARSEAISAKMLAILDKERRIRACDREIFRLIDDELGAKAHPFSPSEPHISELKASGRLDAAIHSDHLKRYQSRVSAYPGGSDTPKELGFKVGTGPSLEIKLLGTRIDSDIERPDFYKLLIPANITEEGTVRRYTWLGTPKKLPTLQVGDVLIGEAGFKKGRSLVVDDSGGRLTTNAHGIFARATSASVEASAYLRCIIDWYRTRGLFDLLAVGGSGGHLSPEYFDYIRVPRFGKQLRERVTKLYWNSAAAAAPEAPSSFAALREHEEWDVDAGVVQLSASASTLRDALKLELEALIEDQGDQAKAA